MSGRDWVVVYTAMGIPEASVVKSMLEAYGVRSTLISNAAPSVHALTIDGLGEVQVVVSPRDESTARELIEQSPEIEDEQDSVEDE